MTEPKEREQEDDEATLHSARAAHRRIRVSRRRLRRRRQRGQRSAPRPGKGQPTSPATSASSPCGPARRARPSRPSSTASPRRTRTSTVSYKSAKEPATVLSTSVEGGNPPDIAALPQPGYMTDFAQRGALKPIDFAEDAIKEGYSQSWLDLGTRRREALRPLFQGRQQVDHLVQRARFHGRRRRAGRELGRLPRRPETRWRRPASRPTRSAAPTAGRSPTCSRTSTSATAGPEKYDQLTKHEIPVDRSVGDRRAHADGQAAPVRQDRRRHLERAPDRLPDLGDAGLRHAAEGGAGPRGRLRRRRHQRRRPRRKPETDFNVYAFPEINDSGPVVMGGGDVMVMFKDNPAARALIEYLATPGGGRDLGRKRAASRRRTRTSTRTSIRTRSRRRRPPTSRTRTSSASTCPT